MIKAREGAIRRTPLLIITPSPCRLACRWFRGRGRNSHQATNLQRVFGNLNAQMDSGIEQHHIRVSGRGGIKVLDAHCLGDWCIQFHSGIFLIGPSGSPGFLPQQRQNLCTLIEEFGPNQLVLVTNPGNPFPLAGTDLFSPETLHSCLELRYVCQAVIIHGVPKSSEA